MAVLSHQVIKTYIIAAIVAGVLSSLIYQVVAYLDAGFLEPFFMIAFVTGALLSFGIALVVGVPFMKKRKKQT